MTLLSSVREYELIELITREPRFGVYRSVCGGRWYLVYIVRSEALENALAERLCDLSESGFDGFCEFFGDADALIAVFRYNALEKTAADYLDEDTTETEKLMFFGRVLEAFCVHEVPPDIACDLLQNDNVGVTSEGGADCRYILRELSAFEKRDMRSLAGIFSKKLKQALAPVGKTKRTAVIDRFLSELIQSPPAAMTEFYDRYTACVEECKGIELGETKLRRLKNRVLKAANVGRTVLMIAVLALAVVMLVMSLNEDNSRNQKLDRIGGVTVEESVSQ